MPDKDTLQLENELSEAKDFEKFFDDNEEEFFQNFSLVQYLEYLLKEKKLKKVEVIKKSLLNPVYAYHIFAGRKNPSRVKILSLAVAMNLTVKETQRLLYFANVEKLYVKNTWDGIIMFALENNFDIERANNLIQKFSESPFLGDVD